MWSSRIRNVLANDDLDSFGLAWRLGAAIVFLALALVCAVWLWRGRPGALSLGVLAGWTVAYWLVRGTGILLDGNHAAGFKVIHTVLMAVSLGLVLLAAHGVGKTVDDRLGVSSANR